MSVAGTGNATASGRGAVANSGYIHALTVVHQEAPRARKHLPHQVGVIPPRALAFQYRAVSGLLHTAVGNGGTAVLHQVLSGLGGVGKTQLAAEYARRAWRERAVDLLLWVTASSRAEVLSGYAHAAADVLGADPERPEQAAREFLAWLEPKPRSPRCRWLIVLDDLSELADMRGLWPPGNPLGRTLVTTRRKDAALSGHGRRMVTVGLFTAQEAVSYLTEVLAARDRREPPAELAALAADLGYLPLALSQAAAHLVDEGLDCAAYRRLLAARTTKLRDTMPEEGGFLPDDQATTAAATWSLSIDRAGTMRPGGLAPRVLHLAAMLDPNGIPGAVMSAAPVLVHLGTAAEPLPADQVTGALRVLNRLSLLEHIPDTPHHAIRVHQLVQRSVRDGLSEERRHQVARTAADALAAAWPEIQRDTVLAGALRTNADALLRHSPEALWEPGAHALLFRLGTSLGESGYVTAATQYFHELAHTAAERLGADDRATHTARFEHASWRGQAGDAAGAAGGLADLLHDCERVLGPESRQALTVRSHLARWRGEAGDTGGAATMTAELVRTMGRVLGPDCVDTLAARGNLARWQGRSDDPSGAADAFAHLVVDRERVLGTDHPLTLAAWHGVAFWRGEAGDAPGAVEAFTDLLEHRMRVLGPDHPHVLTTRHDLARWQGTAGDTAGAVTALAGLLADRERVLGPDHPATIATRAELATWCDLVEPQDGA
ncbi:tetratricopeptide repeat protein [Streptomyces sp. TRM49041]|uniref:tetratricopeptide repeat protein n=1 Tax=Streptomyces sp. TRM49041 TaxID=2603216 RepID=UPI0016568C95|nr:tetratricopeptide repeat protein [Streptomyces sp. TRM49041]